jgi:sugar lactone lactonase YvrE
MDKITHYITIALIFFLLSFNTYSQEVSTISGNIQGFADGPAAEAQFYFPHGVAVAPDGTLFVADTYNKRIRKITTNGEVTTLAGSETPGFADGTGAAAQFWVPIAIAIGGDGILYVADYHRIRKITPEGVVTTLAGSTSGVSNGVGASAKFNQPTGIAVTSDGILYVADTANHRIRKITPNGTVTTLAGSSAGYNDGPANGAQFDTPGDIAVTPDGTLFVADTFNHLIRKITPTGTVSTFAGDGYAGFANGLGTAARFYSPIGIATTTDGTLYVAEHGTHHIRKISADGTVTAIAGNGYPGFADGPGSSAQLYLPKGVCVTSAGVVYVGDNYNNRIRKITPLLNTMTYIENQISLHPNPASTFINLEMENLIPCRIDICDIHGRMIITNVNTSPIDISNLPIGIYIIGITTDSGITYKKLVKQ